ncbi:DedA family protein [Amycolatopsis suaedae]|uniref:DedA family protein n=1 Tax=Amycolatopsis suaedae TaxID=2510978 RepID=A0A4V2EMB3_9PSEU|nr:DedA family protein [Amycolatopsis suaedae]RZQ64465.1 DedA family protein [Amycolatopsis suaedae]
MDLLTHLTELLRGSLGSPWLWLVVFAVAGLDALLPFMPSEGTVIAVAVLLAGQDDHAGLLLLVLVTAVGALAGDCLGHLVGRTAGPHVVARLQRGEKGRRRYAWARERVDRHAVLLIVAARYLPGGRVAAGLATGSMRYPIGRFVALDALGCVLWAVYSVVIGYVGGAGFADRPLLGLLVAFGVGLLMVGVLAGVRRAARSGRQATEDDDQPCQRTHTVT